MLLEIVHLLLDLFEPGLFAHLLLDMRQQLFVLFIHLPVVDIQQSETQDESRREKHQLQRCFERHGACAPPSVVFSPAG